MKRKKKSLMLFGTILMFLTFITSNIAFAADVTTLPTPTLNVTPNNEGNFISLNWTKPDESKNYSYMIYSKRSTDTEYQSIPSKGTVKVLNIYPNPVTNIIPTDDSKDLDGKTIPNSGILKTWLEKENINAITIDCVSLTSFNENPSKYLKKSNGMWNYDSVFYGMWNIDSQKIYPNDTAIEYLRTFINDGGGFMTSHHSIGNRGLDRGVNKLAKELGVEIFGRAQANFNPNQPSAGRTYSCRDANNNLFPTVSFEVDDPSSLPNIDNTSYWNASKKVKLVKRGLLNNYPFKVGNVEDTFDIPFQHGLSVFAKGDVWMTSVNPTGFKDLPFKEITESPSTGAKGTNNFYLHTYNNTAIINSGHSFPDITQAETRIIANTLYYLSQVTDQTSWDDHKGQDVNPPTKPNKPLVTTDIISNKTNITFDPSTDNGTTYDYYVEATELTSDTKTKSDTKKGTITSGLKGYSIVVDQKPDTVPSNTVNATSNNFTIDQSYSGDFYVHIAAIDNVGNMSEVSTYKYSYPTLTLTPSTTSVTSDPVTITATATSSTSEIEKIQTPNGNWVNSSTTDYVVSENGTYSFTAIDKDGLQTTQNITVSNIVPKVVLNIEPEKDKIHLNENVSALLTIDNIKEIAAEDVRIKYDSTKLQFLGCNELDGIKLMKNDVQAGELRFILLSKGAANIVNSKKALLKLNFKGIAPGDALVDITKGRVSDGITMEKDLKDAECGQAFINISEQKLFDVNKDGEFTLLDLAIDGRHFGEDPVTLPQYNTDVVINGSIDDTDFSEIIKLMLQNPNYKF